MTTATLKSLTYRQLKTIEAKDDCHGLHEALDDFDTHETYDGCTLRLNNKIMLDCYTLVSDKEAVIVVTESSANHFLLVDEAWNVDDADLTRVAIYDDAKDALADITRSLKIANVFAKV
tara:strand:+ start:588 stop:944 length:357 start_codon:yes stop_codon:yes gene_type:complete